MECVIRTLQAPPPQDQSIEVVERKGIGHPDTICDAIAERICVRLSRYYLQRFGAILHHNVDKILLCGGSAHPAFGGGEVQEPLEFYLSGRTTGQYRGEKIPVGDLAVETCRTWLQQHLPELDIERHVRIVPRFRAGSSDLTGLFQRAGRPSPACNDTSCGAGFAPFTPLERAVLAIERTLNSPAAKERCPAIGQDIKVMGVRHEQRVQFTIGCAMIGRHLGGMQEYLNAKEEVSQIASAAAGRFFDLPVEVIVNAADDPDAGQIYLTVTGTSAESGDDGEVGRGNRVSGLITPYRPMALEAAAGKNPVSHVGKLYSLAATAIATRAQELANVRSATCVLVSQIGRPLDDPLIVDLGVYLDSATRSVELTPVLETAVQSELSKFPQLQAALLAESVPIY